MMQAAMSGKKETVAELLKHDKVDANAQRQEWYHSYHDGSNAMAEKRLLLNC
jgi:hypothetical protein